MADFGFGVAVDGVEKTIQLSEKIRERLKKEANRRAALKYALSVGLKPKNGSKQKIRKFLNEEIIRIFKSKKIKQIDLAISSQTSRPRITRLLNRKTKQFTIDAMINILDILGATIKIEFPNP